MGQKFNIGEEVGIFGLTSKRIQQSGMIAMGGDKKDLDKLNVELLQLVLQLSFFSPYNIFKTSV